MLLSGLDWGQRCNVGHAALQEPPEELGAVGQLGVQSQERSSAQGVRGEGVSTTACCQVHRCVCL